jgi:hypothetical protein
MASRSGSTSILAGEGRAEEGLGMRVLRSFGKYAKPPPTLSRTNKEHLITASPGQKILATVLIIVDNLTVC